MSLTTSLVLFDVLFFDLTLILLNGLLLLDKKIDNHRDLTGNGVQRLITQWFSLLFVVQLVSFVICLSLTIYISSIARFSTTQLMISIGVSCFFIGSLQVAWFFSFRNKMSR